MLFSMPYQLVQKKSIPWVEMDAYAAHHPIEESHMEST